MSLDILKDQFGCCVKLLKMISEEDKAEAIKHMKTVLMEFEFKNSSINCKESVKNEYFEDNIKKEEDVKPDMLKLVNSYNHAGKRKREIFSNVASDIFPKCPSVEGIKMTRNPNESEAGCTEARAFHQSSTRSTEYDSGWNQRHERNNVWGEEWRVGEDWTGQRFGGDYYHSGWESGKQVYAYQDPEIRFNEAALGQRVLDINGKERAVFTSYAKKGMPLITCNVACITVSGNRTLSTHMSGKKHLQRLEDFTLI